MNKALLQFAVIVAGGLTVYFLTRKAIPAAETKLEEIQTDDFGRIISTNPEISVRDVFNPERRYIPRYPYFPSDG